MTKKKNRQTDPGSPGGDDSSESGEDNTQAAGKACQHVARGVDLNSIRKVIAKIQINESCIDCSKDNTRIKPRIGGYANLTHNTEKTEEKEKEDEDEGSGGMWLCLRCGFQACGPPSKPTTHIAKHFATPRSDIHALSTNTDQWNVWCTLCNCEMAANSTKKLQECVEYLKRQPRSTTVTVILPRPQSARRSGAAVDISEEAQPDKETPKRPGSKTVTLAAVPPSSPTPLVPKVKGLSNLGNTCFFNAVMQCLAQTPYLVSLLRETSDEGEQFFLKGCPEGGKDQSPVDSLEGTLGAWGPLTEALSNTLAEMQEPGGSGVVTPRRLLDVLSQRAPHLSQGDQQDSQELLRHLMEGVRSEELRRFQDKILTAVGLTRKSDPSTVDDETKAKAKVYNHQASQLLLRPDQLFQGRLISTLQCQDCLRQSHTQEFFLDLSLPIASDRPPPPQVLRAARRDAAEAEQVNKDKDGPSKHQLKKERRLAHKNRKKQRGSRQNSAEPGEDNQDDGTGNNSEESKQSDADVEDNEDQDMASVPPDAVTSNGVDVVDNHLPETQDRPLDLSNKPLDLSNKTKSCPITIDECGVARCAVDNVQADDQGGGESGYATNGGTQSNSPGSPTSATEEIEGAHPSTLRSELASLALGDKEEAASSSPAEGDKLNGKTEQHAPEEQDEKTDKEKSVEQEEGACALEPPDEEEAEEEDSQFWSQTLAQRPHSVSENDGECSIQSCLNQFAAIELLTGNNRVSCKTCTQRAGVKGGKMVCTNSTKQLLVSAPPAILTLHLKRFEVYGARFRKVCRPVSFPLLLDLASICSLKCKELPSVGAEQTSLLYSLYGVVEHSGALSGGHYVAYVKARQQPDKGDPRYKFLLSNTWYSQPNGTSKAECASEEGPPPSSTSSDPPAAEGESAGAEGGLPEPPPGKWYYVSDSRVQEVSEKKVLQTQAYLLFYERIL